jgi:hypothetical protein
MLIFFSELVWVILYTLTILVGLINDDLNATSLSFLLLGVAGLEFSLGFLILLLFKNTNSSYFLTKGEAVHSKSHLHSINKLVGSQINF